MNESVKFLILTGPSFRHRALANLIKANVKGSQVAAFLFSKNETHISNAISLGSSVELAQHANRNYEMEERFFSESEGGFTDEDVFFVGPVHYQEKEVLEWAREYRPDVLLAFGCPILGDGWFELDCRKFNLHLGYSPFYVGSGTLAWPFVNDEPELAGITFQELDRALDMGKYFFRVRLGKPSGDFYWLVNELLKNSMIEVCKFFMQDNWATKMGKDYPEKLNPKKYKRKDFSSEQVLKIWSKYGPGTKGEYEEIIID